MTLGNGQRQNKGRGRQIPGCYEPLKDDRHVADRVGNDVWQHNEVPSVQTDLLIKHQLQGGWSYDCLEGVWSSGEVIMTAIMRLLRADSCQPKTRVRTKVFPRTKRNKLVVFEQNYCLFGF